MELSRASVPFSMAKQGDNNEEDLLEKNTLALHEKAILVPTDLISTIVG